MFIAISFLLMVLLFLAGIPVVFSIAIISVSYLIINNIPMVTLAQRLITGVDSFALMAAPLFMLAGFIMSSGGSTRRLIELADATVGHFRGGLVHVNILCSMIFAGMSGSATADSAGIGTIELKMMKDAGYDTKFSAAITAASSTIGPIIPPSVPFVIYGPLAQVSVGRLFLGGAIPGILMGLYLMVVTYFIAKKRNFPKGDAFSLKRLLRAIKNSLFELVTPVILLGGIVGGIFTTTEAAVVAVFYALFLEIVIRKEMSIKDLPKIALEAGKLTGIIMFIIAAASIFSWIIMREQAGQDLVKFVLSVTENRVLIILFMTISLLVLGCFIETIACIIISYPILSPLANQIGLDPIHFGVILVLAIMIGMLTPPVGLCMYIVCAIVKISIMDFFRAVFPFFIALLMLLITVAFIPSLTLWLPNLIMGK